MRNEIRLRAELVRLKIKLKVKNNEDLISADHRNPGNVLCVLRICVLHRKLKIFFKKFSYTAALCSC